MTRGATLESTRDRELAPLGAGSSEAEEFTASYKTGMGQLVSLFRSKGIGPEEAADLAHETLLKTLVHLRRHGRERSDLGPLVHTIARNLLVERVRRVRPVIVPIDDEMNVADLAPEPEDRVIATERQMAVRQAVSALAPRHRHVVTLWMEGRTPTEIARHLGIKRNAVDAILHRARRSLASKLEGSGLLGWVGLLGARLRLSFRRAAGRCNAIQLVSQAAPATTGLLAVGLAAVMAVSAPSVQAPRPGVHVGNGSSTASHGPALAGRTVGGIQPGGATIGTPNVSADVRAQKVDAGTSTRSPVTGNDERFGITVWHGRGQDRRVSGPMLDTAANTACDAASSTCRVGR